jgi:O-antigen ligase
LENVLTYLQLIGLILVLWDLYTSWTAVRAGLQAYVLGGYISVASVVLDYTKGGASVYQARYTAVGFDENDIGLILALGVPIAWYLATFARPGKRSYASRLANYLYIPAAVVAISLTASRAAFLTLLPALAFILVSFTRINLYARVLLFAGLLGLVVSLPAVVPQAAMQRLETTGNEMAEGDFNGRMRIWREGIVAFQGHPFIGSGSGAFKAAIVPIMAPPPKAAHNFVLCYLVECGVIGLGLFMVVLWMTFAYARRQPKWISRLWLAILAMWLMGASSHNWELRKQTWLLFGFMVIGAHLPSLELSPPEPFPRKGGSGHRMINGPWSFTSKARGADSTA